MIKGSIEEEGKTNVNIYAPNAGAQQNTRQILTAIKGETDSNTIVGKFNTLLSFNRQITQTENKETQTLNDILEQIN